MNTKEIRKILEIQCTNLVGIAAQINVNGDKENAEYLLNIVHELDWVIDLIEG